MSATHRLSLEITKPHAAVWKAFTGDIHSWWPKDFYVTESPQRIVLEVRPGGRLYEDSGKGISAARPRLFLTFVFGQGQIGNRHGGQRFHFRLPGRH